MGRRNRIFIFSALAVFFFCSDIYCEVIELLSSPVLMSKSFLPMREINIKASFDFGGKCDFHKNIGGPETKKTDAGQHLSFAAEYMKYCNEYIAAGAGVSVQIPRTLEGYSGKFSFAPLYLSVKVRSWPQEPGLYAYVFGRFGYNFFYGDGVFKDKFSIEKGGFYYAAGIGIIYRPFIVECKYGVNSGAVKYALDKTSDMDYGKFSVSFGFTL